MQLPNVPALRFPEFSGEWSKDCLNEFLEVQPARNTQGIYSKDDVLSVSGDYGVVNQIQLLGRSFAGKDVSNYHIVRTNDIVYTKSPLKEFPYGIVKTNQGTAGIVSTLYAVYSAKSNTDPKFVEYYFSSKERTNKYFKPIVRIGAKHDMKIGNEEVLRNIVVFPSKQEQNKIQEFLRIIDERIRVQSKIIEEQETLLKSLADSSIKALCDGQCKKVPFSELYERAGEGGTPSTSERAYYDNGDIPFIKIDDLKSKYITKHQDTISELGLKNSSAWIIPENSVIYSNGATIGAVSINTYPISTKQGILGVVPISIVYTEYLYYLMSSTYFAKKINRIVTEGTMKTAYLKDINNILCPLPPLDTQIKIAKGLASLSERLEVEMRILEQYKLQKGVLLSRMFI